jgi:polysaccharide export outer membrane protein
VAQENEYFVIGEVKKEGRYTFSGERTLLEAITIAGGYSEYADPRKIVVKRAGDTLRFNARRIESNDVDDPLIQAGDIVRVPRHWF